MSCGTSLIGAISDCYLRVGSGFRNPRLAGLEWYGTSLFGAQGPRPRGSITALAVMLSLSDGLYRELVGYSVSDIFSKMLPILVNTNTDRRCTT